MRLLASAVVLSIALGVAAKAQFDEYGVKAAFVRNVLAYVEWPAQRLPPNASIVVCVFNDSPITSRLIALNIAAVAGHAVRVRTAAGLPDLAACHVAFVPATETEQLKELISRYPGSGLLTFSEDHRSARTGAAINLVVADRRVGFEVDLESAQSQGLHISSKLLTLARRLHGARTPPRIEPATAAPRPDAEMGR